MNKLNKILWGIISGAVSIVYNIDSRATTEDVLVSFAGIGGYTNFANKDIIIDCGSHGTITFGIASHSTESNKTTIPTGATNCMELDRIVKEYTQTITQTCTNSQQINYKSDNWDTLCTNLCIDNGTTDTQPRYTTRKKELKQLSCYQVTTGGSGHTLYGFSFIVKKITPKTASFIDSHLTATSAIGTDEDFNKSVYLLQWRSLNNNSLSDCYIKKDGGSDNSGAFYYEEPKTCYYVE